ncbi:MAG: hypothetical protein H6921_14740 [Sphingomonas sp.]|nr:hypothetical protein [Sphingomonas sp.]
MPQFTFAVTETRNYEMQYAVEAATPAEAREKAEIGDTVVEIETSFTGVSNRYVAEQLPMSRLKSTHGFGSLPAWREHPNYPVDDWKYAVANGDTRLGYLPWIAAQEHG